MNSFVTKIRDWYLSKGAIPYWLIFITDCLVVFLSLIFVQILNCGVLTTFGHFEDLCLTLLLYVAVYALCFHRFHTYVGVVRYASFVDLRRIALAVGTAVVICMVLKYAFANEYLYPIRAKDLFLASILAMALMWFIRIVVKYWFDSVYTLKEVTNVYIFGVREGGVALAKSIRSQKPVRYRLKGFVTDDPALAPYTLMGVKVYPANDKLIGHLIDDKVGVIFISPLASEALRRDNELVDDLISSGIRIFMMPDECEWNSAQSLSHKQLHEVEVEDLLPRDKITIDLDNIEAKLSGSTILVTGAAGSIGSEIVTQVAAFSPSVLVMVDQAETPLHDLMLRMQGQYPDTDCRFILGDVANALKMEEVFEVFRPQYVFHAAAYKHVPMMEDNPAESIQNNVVGTRIVADLAVKYGVEKFVMISTDKAVNPSNVMGCSKRICEMYVQSLDKAVTEGRVEGRTHFVTTRFGNVLGSNGSVIPLFKEQISRGGPVTVTHPDIIRYFMLISEACKLVLEAAIMGNGGEIFVFDMGEPVKIVDLATRMIQLSGADIEIVFSGLRPGEKLYEELLNDKEETLPTFHPKIKIARVRQYDFSEVKEKIDEMQRLNFTDDPMAIVARMKQLVPEFKSMESRFQVLDSDPSVTSE